VAPRLEPVEAGWHGRGTGSSDRTRAPGAHGAHTGPASHTHRIEQHLRDSRDGL
jgi:hypothetical protein